jgi:carbonic anhydrase
MIAGTFSMIPASELSLALADNPAGAPFENLGTTVEVVAKEGEGESPGTMSFQGVEYQLQQFHFHLPSEHLDDGASMAMETHFVWESAAGDIAVVGVWIDIEDGAGAGANVTAPAVAKRSGGRDEKRKEMRAREVESERQKRQLPSVEGSFFHITAPTTAATTPSSLLETVLSSVSSIATPGTVTQTQPLALSEVASVLNAGSFQT